MSIQAEQIRAFILDNLPQHPENIVAVAAQKFGVTRTTIHRHLTTLLEQGQIFKSGTTRNIHYRLQSSLARRLHYPIPADISEFTLFQRDMAQVCKEFPNHVYDISSYAFTSMVNNALTHSNGTQVTVESTFEDDHLHLTVTDNGQGIFHTLAQFHHYKDIREAILHLTKGKLSTKTEHKGEGIFFTSRACDRFEIYANQLHYRRDNHCQDWAMETVADAKQGTAVHMYIHQHTPTTLVDLFKQYQYQNDAAFSRTEILVSLSQWGEEPLISREQAARVITGLEKFRHITLDFTGVRWVGQGFVEEVFRVFKQAHPDIVIDTVGANADVSFMIRRCG
jgi:hypothetical protein